MTQPNRAMLRIFLYQYLLQLQQAIDIKMMAHKVGRPRRKTQSPPELQQQVYESMRLTQERQLGRAEMDITEGCE